jgi:hypothetical protein
MTWIYMLFPGVQKMFQNPKFPQISWKKRKKILPNKSRVWGGYISNHISKAGSENFRRNYSKVLSFLKEGILLSNLNVILLLKVMWGFTSPLFSILYCFSKTEFKKCLIDGRLGDICDKFHLFLFFPTRFKQIPNCAKWRKGQHNKQRTQVSVFL